MKTVRPRIFLMISCAMFLAFGMFNAGIGPVLSEFAANTGSNLSAVGSIFTFLFLGSLAAQVVGGPLNDRFGHLRILFFSLILLALGLAGFTNARSLPLMLGLVFITGIGQGAVDLGGNLVVSDAYPENNTAYLNLLHFFFGVGAFVGPALVGVAIARTGSGLVIHWAASIIFLLLAVCILVLMKRIKTNPGTRTPEEKLSGRSGEEVYGSALLWIAGLFLLIYVGVEYGAGSWVTTYMNQTTGMLIQNGALVTSAYWGSLTLGRLAGATGSRKFNRLQLLAIAMAGTLAGVIGLVLSIGTMVPTILFIMLIGLSFGTIYPTTVAVTIHAFPKDQGKAVGLLAAMGSIGGLLMPWIAGILLEKVSPLSYTLLLSFGAGVMVVLLILVKKLISKPEA